MQVADAIHHQLERWLDEGERAGLDEACALLAQSSIDMPALLDWLQQQRSDEERKSLAQRRVRAALGLSLIPGPVCRR